MLDLPATTLRFWEKEFEQLKPRRNDHNRRYYTPKDIETLRIISYLIKTRGHKIEAAKEQLRKNRKNLSRSIEVIEKLKEVRSDLEGVLHSLNIRGLKLGISNE